MTAAEAGYAAQRDPDYWEKAAHYDDAGQVCSAQATSEAETCAFLCKLSEHTRRGNALATEFAALSPARLKD
jgi:dTDP-4-amino-4,6-dideoxygalactose transaminase